MKKFATVIQAISLTLTLVWVIAGLCHLTIWGLSRIPTLADHDREFDSLSIPFAIMEYPEKELIALCIASITAVLAANVLSPKGLQNILWWTTIGFGYSVGFYSFLGKVTVSFFSEDGDIAQWHHICVSMAILLLTITSIQI